MAGITDQIICAHPKFTVSEAKRPHSPGNLILDGRGHVAEILSNRTVAANFTFLPSPRRLRWTHGHP